VRNGKNGNTNDGRIVVVGRRVIIRWA